MAVLAAATVLVLGGFIAIASADAVMAFHGALIAAAALLAGLALLGRLTDGDKAEATSFYNDGPIKVAAVATVFWGVAGFLVGDVLAWQMAFPVLNFDLPWTNFGRLRPVHTSAVIFASVSLSSVVVKRTALASVCRWMKVSLSGAPRSLSPWVPVTSTK